MTWLGWDWSSWRPWVIGFFLFAWIWLTWVEFGWPYWVAVVSGVPVGLAVVAFLAALHPPNGV